MTTILVILALSFLIFIHELGHFSTAKFFGIKVLEFGIGFPPRIFGKKKGETTYSINALPFGGFVKILGEDGEEKETESEHEEEKKDPKRSFVFQSAWKKVVMLAAGVVMNFVFGVVALSIVFMVGVPKHLVVVDILEGSPAYESTLESRDIMLEAKSDGVTLKDPIKSDDFILLTQSSENREILLKVRRDGEILDISVIPVADEETGKVAIGAYLADAGAEPESFFAAIAGGARETWNISKLVVSVFVNMIQKVFTSPGQATENIAGPLGIIVIAKETSSLGFMYFIQLLAIISINLAVLNLLPFPALDGGRILVVLIERIKGSPVSRNIQIAVNGAGLLLLLILMIFVTVGDVQRFF